MPSSLSSPLPHDGNGRYGEYFDLWSQEPRLRVRQESLLDYLAAIFGSENMAFKVEIRPIWEWTVIRSENCSMLSGGSKAWPLCCQIVEVSTVLQVDVVFNTKRVSPRHSTREQCPAVCKLAHFSVDSIQIKDACRTWCWKYECLNNVVNPTTITS